jgi:hypothetical protein
VISALISRICSPLNHSLVIAPAFSHRRHAMTTQFVAPLTSLEAIPNLSILPYLSLDPNPSPSAYHYNALHPLSFSSVAANPTRTICGRI